MNYASLHILAGIAPLVIAACSQAPADAQSEPQTPQHLAAETAADARTSEISAAQSPNMVTAQTADGVTVYGKTYFSILGPEDPLILLFHQGGSSGRGEYTGIAHWLTDSGYRAIAWDQRSGGGLHGRSNRTVDALKEGTPAEYCDAYADLEAALNYAIDNKLAQKVIVWGSSYSGALIFRLASDYPDHVAGLIAFSPASGGPLENCRARIWADKITAPMLVLRPASEMERETSVEQREILTAAGAEFIVVENGVHGSSMLLDGRTENDMTGARAAVMQWLDRVRGNSEGNADGNSGDKSGG